MFKFFKKRIEIIQYVQKLESENDHLKNEIYRLKLEKDTLNDSLDRANKMNVDLYKTNVNLVKRRNV